jgi:hypothetical protein
MLNLTIWCLLWLYVGLDDCDVSDLYDPYDGCENCDADGSLDTAVQETDTEYCNEQNLQAHLHEIFLFWFLAWVPTLAK